MTETLPQQSYFAIWLQTWLPIIFSGLILVVIAIQAYIYKKQWNAMQLQLEAMKSTSRFDEH